MEQLGHQEFNHPHARFALDNIIDGAKDATLLVWEAYDTHRNESVWVLGRKIPARDGTSLEVLPCAILVHDSLACVRRYAPALARGGWDYSQVEGGAKIISP